jgi:hypothetical protein
MEGARRTVLCSVTDQATGTPIPVPQLIESKDLEWRGRSFARSDSAMLRLPAAGKKSKPGIAGELDAAVEAMKRVPWTTLEEMKGDAELLKKIDDAQALLKSLRRTLSS